MRICYFAPPGSVHTRRWLEYMQGKGHNLQIVASGPKEDSWPQLWPIHTLPTSFPGEVPRIAWRVANLTKSHGWVPAVLWLLGAIRIRRLIQKLKPELIHIHYIDDMAISALLCGFHPTVATAWGSDLLIAPNLYSLQQRGLLRHALSSVDLLTCNSDALLQAALKLGARAGRTRICQWGVDLKEFRHRQDMSNLRGKLGIESSSVVVLSPRSLQRPLYCIEGILRAFGVVLRRCQDAILIQLNANSDTEERTRLEKVATDLGIASHVRWLGYVTEEDLPRVFSTADLTVSLATSDSLPTSLLEAMASGSVPIFSNVGGVGDWIVPEQNGMLVPPGDYGALATAILQVLDKPSEWWEQARLCNREIVHLRADRDRELGQAAEDYLRLVARYAGRRIAFLGAKGEGFMA